MMENLSKKNSRRRKCRTEILIYVCEYWSAERKRRENDDREIREWVEGGEDKETENTKKQKKLRKIQWNNKKQWMEIYQNWTAEGKNGGGQKKGNINTGKTIN